MNPNELYKITALGRALDPFKYPTNRYIMILTVVAGVLAGVYSLATGGDLGTAILAGIYAGAAVFITWVLSRDADPDNPYSAFVGAALALFFIPSPLALLSLAALVIVLRLVSRIVGTPTKIWDIGAALLILVAALLVDGWIIGVVAAIAFLMDALLVNGVRVQLGSAVIAIVGTVLAVLSKTPVITAPSALYLAQGIIVLIAFAVVIWTSTRFTTMCDAPNVEVEPIRIRAAMSLLAITGILSMFGGDAGMAAFVPVWTAMAGISLYRIVFVFLNNRQPVSV